MAFGITEGTCACCTLACDHIIHNVVDVVGAAKMILSTSSPLLGSSSDERRLGVKSDSSVGSGLGVSSSNGVKVPEGHRLGSTPTTISSSSSVHTRRWVMHIISS